MSLLEQIIEIMADFRGGAHVNEIAKMLAAQFPNIPIPTEKLPEKITAILAADVKKKNGKAQFSKVKNNNNGFKRGIYRLKKKPVVTPVPSLTPVVTTQYTGKAGENAVLSELLFYGFNASSMAVDDGIDIVASKNNHYFHIQVKTSNPSENGSFLFSIKKSSFTAKDSFQTFYILVIRNKEEFRYSNDFLILPSSQVRQLIEVGVIKDGATFSLKVQKDNRGRFILNAKQDVTISINTFSQLT